MLASFVAVEAAAVNSQLQWVVPFVGLSSFVAASPPFVVGSFAVAVVVAAVFAFGVRAAAFEEMHVVAVEAFDLFDSVGALEFVEEATHSPVSVAVVVEERSSFVVAFPVVGQASFAFSVVVVVSHHPGFVVASELV